MRRRGSLAARDTNRSVQLVRLQLGGGMCARASQKCTGHRNLCILQIGTTSSRCIVSTPHVRNSGSTWGQHWPTRPQLGPNLDPIGSNLAPTSVQHAGVWPQVGPVWEQLHPKSRSTWLENVGHGRRPNYPPTTRFHFYFPSHR